MVLVTVAKLLSYELIWVGVTIYEGLMPCFNDGRTLACDDIESFYINLCRFLVLDSTPYT